MWVIVKELEVKPLSLGPFFVTGVVVRVDRFRVVRLRDDLFGWVPVKLTGRFVRWHTRLHPLVMILKSTGRAVLRMARFCHVDTGCP